MRVVRDILGHSEMGTTANIYAHVLPSMQQEAMGKGTDYSVDVIVRLRAVAKNLEHDQNQGEVSLTLVFP